MFTFRLKFDEDISVIIEGATLGAAIMELEAAGWETENISTIEKLTPEQLAAIGA